MRGLIKDRGLDGKVPGRQTFGGSINGNELDEFKRRDEFEKVGCKTGEMRVAEYV